jgi:hypothetical protein
MAVDLGLGAMHGQERHEPGRAAETTMHVKVARGDEERQRRGDSRAKNEDDGGEEEDEAIYIWGTFSPR